MKSLKVVILESILDDIDVQMREGDKFVKDTIKDFLKANFKTHRLVKFQDAQIVMVNM